MLSEASARQLPSFWQATWLMLITALAASKREWALMGSKSRWWQEVPDVVWKQTNLLKLGAWLCLALRRGPPKGWGSAWHKRLATESEGSAPGPRFLWSPGQLSKRLLGSYRPREFSAGVGRAWLGNTSVTQGLSPHQPGPLGPQA